MTTKMVVQQPQPVMVSMTSNEWSSGICDCFHDVPQCCFAFWCFPCFTCVTAKKYGECLCLPLLEYICCFPAISTSMRTSMRQRYGISGDIWQDCVYGFFCTSCSWCQMAREMKGRSIPVVMLNTRAH
ncbi:unnamed protein product [Knipowitschia caucasica]